MVTVTCKLPASLAAQLSALAREQHCSKSAVLREALEARLHAKRGPKAVMALDLVKHLRGSVKGDIPDLATNPEHMRGFGL